MTPAYKEGYAYALQKLGYNLRRGGFAPQDPNLGIQELDARQKLEAGRQPSRYDTWDRVGDYQKIMTERPRLRSMTYDEASEMPTRKILQMQERTKNRVPIERWED